MYLLDTNILSELMKRHPNHGLVTRLRLIAPDELFTSVICVLELRFGSALRPDFPAFWAKIEREIISRVTVIPFGNEEAIVAGDILSELKKKGRNIGLEDVMIGASAMANKLIVVTANIRHFSRIEGLRVENWLAT